MNEMELNASNCAEEVVEIIELPESLGKKILKKSIVGLCLTAATVGIIVAIRKGKDKLDIIRAKKLEKHGWTCFKNFDEDDYSDEENVNEDVLEEK